MTDANALISAEMDRLQKELDAAKQRYLNLLVRRVPGGELTIQNINNSTIEVAGYGVVFDVPGLDGGRFDKDTSLRFPGQPETQGLFALPNPGVYWDHGFDEIVQLSRLGEVQEGKPDQKGVWIRAILDRSAEYMEWIEELLQNTDVKLGWSGGSTAHLNRWISDTREVWPAVEFSITPTPAQPLTLGVHIVQSLKPDAVGLLDRLASRSSNPVASAALESAASQDAADESAEQTSGEAKSDEVLNEPLQDDGVTQSAEGESSASEESAESDSSEERPNPAAHELRALANLLALERERQALAHLKMEIER